MFSKFITLFLIIYVIKSITTQKEKEIKVSDADLNKAISCLHVLSGKFDHIIDQKDYSSTMLACFTSITEVDAKEILVAVQQGMNFLSEEEIENLCDVNKLKNMDREKLSFESKKLQNALIKFDKLRAKDREKKNSKTRDDSYNEDDDYKNSHPSQGNKFGKFMKKMKNLLKLINNFGKIIIGIICLYFIYFLWKNKKQNNYVHKYEDYNKIAKNIKKNKKKKN